MKSIFKYLKLLVHVKEFKRHLLEIRKFEQNKSLRSKVPNSSKFNINGQHLQRQTALHENIQLYALYVGMLYNYGNHFIMYFSISINSFFCSL